MLLIRSLSILLLSNNQSTISYNCPRVTTYKLVSAILVSPNPKVITAVVITGAFGGILFNFSCFNTITLVVNI